VRRSQLLTGAGPGALVDLVNDAVIVGGLDSWGHGNDHEGYIVEPRLQAKAQKLLSAMEWWHHPDVRLRLPPLCNDDQPRKAVGIQVQRFPSWYMCQNPACRSLVHWKGLEKNGRHKCSTTATKKPTPVVPIRFVTACPNGHVADVAWRWFVHRGQTEEGVEQPPDTDRVFCKQRPGWEAEGPARRRLDRGAVPPADGDERRPR